jgi:hypothetical protein
VGMCKSAYYPNQPRIPSLMLLVSFYSEKSPAKEKKERKIKQNKIKRKRKENPTLILSFFFSSFVLVCI